MDNKHFIWVVPMILLIGFILGYVSGLNIPKSIEFGLDSKTIEFMNDNNTQKLLNSRLNLCSRECVFLTYDNQTDIFRCNHE